MMIFGWNIGLREVNPVESFCLYVVGGLLTVLSRSDLEFPADEPLIFHPYHCIRPSLVRCRDLCLDTNICKIKPRKGIPQVATVGKRSQKVFEERVIVVFRPGDSRSQS